jgi:hypothetical protein
MHQLFQHMGYSQFAVTAIVDEQGIDSLDKLCILKDKEITNLCKVIHHPSGRQIANPNPLHCTARKYPQPRNQCFSSCREQYKAGKMDDCAQDALHFAPLSTR